MTVGITIEVDLSDAIYREQADILRGLFEKFCIVSNRTILFNNIVSAGKGVSLFFWDIDSEGVEQLRIIAKDIGTLIETQDGKVLTVSAVNFMSELPFNGKTLRLRPTEFIRVNPTEVEQFSLPIEQGLIVTFPDVTDSPWVMKEGIWSDDGIWIDNETWKDQ